MTKLPSQKPKIQPAQLENTNKTILYATNNIHVRTGITFGNFMFILINDMILINAALLPWCGK